MAANVLTIRPREAMTPNRPKRQTRRGCEERGGVRVVAVLSSRVSSTTEV